MRRVAARVAGGPLVATAEHTLPPCLTGRVLKAARRETTLLLDATGAARAAAAGTARLSRLLTSDETRAESRVGHHRRKRLNRSARGAVDAARRTLLHGRPAVEGDLGADVEAASGGLRASLIAHGPAARRRGDDDSGRAHRGRLRRGRVGR